MVSIPSFRLRLAMTGTRSQLPTRSPYPLIVPCTCDAPPITPAIALATPHPVSLCKCTPISQSILFFTSFTICSTSCGREPPFVSQRTTQSTPPRAAPSNTSIEKSGFCLYPSKKCSASKKTFVF